jgi:hypothetical protein
MYLNLESEALIRARDVAGLKLPADVQAKAERVVELQAQMDALPAPAEAADASAMVRDGLPLKEAMDRTKALDGEAARATEARAVVELALAGATAQFNLIVDGAREELVVGLRPVLDAIVDECRPHAATLADYTPNYSANALLSSGTEAHLKAFQKAKVLEAKFGALMSYWRNAFAKQTAVAMSMPFDYRWVRPVHQFFTNPSAVLNDKLAGRELNRRGYPVEINPTVLAVASESPDVGFRLATVADLRQVWEAMSQAERNAQ